MPQQRELNIRLGFLFDEKSLKALESRLQRSGERLSRSGDALATAFTLPLAGIGVAAIKSAGDMESLTLALQSQLGSAEAAKKEFQALNEAAKSPGLGVEQAVAGSVRLQGVGLAAEDARKVLIQFGNAIARTGGTAENLDGVTKQFAQMISKGKVLQSDVSVIAENMPAVAGLMQQAFGTSNVEAIRNMGVSGKEFVLQLTKAAETLPRVQGGIKNSIGNALDSLKQSAAKLGDTLNRAFDVTGNIEGFAAGLSSVADGFAALPPVVQNVTLGFAAVLAGIGPMLKLFGAVKIASAQLVGVWDSTVSTAKNLGSGVLSAVKAFQAMNLAMKLTVVGGAIAAITALYFAYDHYANSLSNAEIAQKSVQDVERRASENIAAQKVEVEGLINAYKAENATTAQKKQILSELRRISPEYFGTLRVGKGDVEALTVATARYTDELLKQAKVTAAKDRLVEIEKAILNLNEAAKPSTLQTFGNFLFNAGNATKFAYEQTKSYTSNLNEQKSALEAERDALAKLVTSEAIATVSKKSYTAATVSSSKEITKQGSILKEVLSDITNASEKAKLIGEPADIAKIEALEKGMGRLLDAGFKPTSKEVQNLKNQFDALTKAFKPITIDTIKPKPVSTNPVQSQSQSSSTLPSAENLVKPFEAAKTPAEQLKDIMQGLKDGTISLGDALEQELKLKVDGLNESFFGLGEGMKAAADSAGPAFEALAGSLFAAEGAYTKTGVAALAAAAQIVKAALAATLAKAIEKSFTASGNPLLGIAIAGIAVGAVNALFARVQQSFSKTPKFANGTSFAPGGMALVGEKGPELVNLPTGSQVYSNQRTNAMLSDMAASRQVEVVGYLRASGTDLIAVIENADKKLKRQR